MTQEEYNKRLRTSPKGWYHPSFSNSSKVHYHLTDNKSLCGMYDTFAVDAHEFSKIEPHEDHVCKRCYKKFTKMNNA